MFAYFYQVCLVIFLLQGISLPLLLAVSGVIWWKQNQRLERLKKQLTPFKRSKSGADSNSESILQSLPKFKPLACINCGAGILLRDIETFCPNCQTLGDLPEDYMVEGSVRSEVKGLLKSGMRYWRVANVLTFPLVGWIFFLLILIEPLVLFPTVLIGSNVFSDTWVDRVFVSLGSTVSFLLMLPAFLGFVIWMIIFIILSSLSKSLRRKLPVVPVFEERIREYETAACQACGGGIEYYVGDFACICSYCNVQNFRVEFVRRRRLQAEKQKVQTKFLSFGAMEILDEFVGTFFFVTIILVGASILLCVVYAVKNLL
jgi:hypothetical protein